jgi:hypothetical protein
MFILYFFPCASLFFLKKKLSQLFNKIEVPIRIQQNEKASVPFILQKTCLET